jgi:hypothetical protein
VIVDVVTAALTTTVVVTAFGAEVVDVVLPTTVVVVVFAGTVVVVDVVVVVVDVVEVVEVDVNDPNALTMCGVLYTKPFGAPDVPSPSCPDEFAPQHIAASALMPHVFDHPADNTVTPDVIPTTGKGTNELFIVPSPN